MRMGMAAAVAAVAVVVLAAPESAEAGSAVLTRTCGIAIQIWVWVRSAVYVLAAISLAFMSFQASMLGRFSMGRFAAWAGSLFLLAGVPSVLAYLTSGGVSLAC